MTTSTTNAPAGLAHSERRPLRLAMVEHPGRDRLDGGWWPRSRDLEAELAELVDGFPRQHGRVVRAVYSPPDWDSCPRRVPVSGGYVKAGSFPRDDTHLVRLRTSNRETWLLLVVPPELTAGQGAEALLAASTPGNEHSAAELLATVTEHPDVDPADHWNDEGGAWWGEGTAPSFRTPGDAESR